MPPRTHAQRRRAARDRRRAARQRASVSLAWRDLPAALRDWREQRPSLRRAAAAKSLIAAAALLAAVTGALIGASLYGELVARPAEPVAIVNGEPITAARYADYLALRGLELRRRIAAAPTAAGAAAPDELQSQLATLTFGAVTDLVAAEVVRPAALEMQVEVSDADVDAALAEFVRVVGGQQDDASFEQAFARVRDQTGLGADTIRGVIADRALAAAVAERLASELDPAPEQIRAAQIVTAAEDQAETVVARLKALQPFALVAEQVSIDDSAPDGGDLGWLPRGLMPEVWDQAAFELRPGTRSRPVETPLGWHVILVHERAASRGLAPETADRRRNATFDRWLQTMRADADVEFLLNPDILAWAQERLPDPAPSNTR